MKKKLLLTILSLLILIPGVAHAFTYNSPEFIEIVEQLDMQGHSDHELSTCSMKKIYYDEVLEMLTEGLSVKEILQSYVDEYGQAALREPGVDKNGIMAWVMPFAGLGAGIAIVAFFLVRIRKKSTNIQQSSMTWDSEVEKEIAEKMFDEERRKHF